MINPNDLYKQQFAALAAVYGAYNIPKDDLREISDRCRAGYLAEAGTADLLIRMKQHMIPTKIIEEFVDPNAVSAPPPPKQKDKYKTLDVWCGENVGAQVKVAELEEVSGFSQATCNKYINDHPHIFVKVARGLYEVRDPKVEREREKNGV